MNVLKVFFLNAIEFSKVFHFPPVFLLILNVLLFSHSQYETLSQLYS